MALIVQDRVKVNTTTTGTGTIVLANTAPTGYQSFAVIGDANTTYYTIASQSANEWEVGIGTYFLANSSLSRTTILSSSNANAAVTFSAGTKDVFVTYPANRAVYEDETGNVAGYPITGGSINGTVIGNSNAVNGTFQVLGATKSFNVNGGTNGVQITPGNTGVTPTINSFGGDANVSLNLNTTGSGTVNISAANITGGTISNVSLSNITYGGLGTMSVQNANAVTITGGSINNTTIGGTNAAAGTFTNVISQTETIRGTGQNAFPFSEQFDNAAWGQNDVTVIANSVTAPNGTTTADTITEANTTAIHRINTTNGSYIAGSSYTLSLYVQNGDRNFVQLVFPLSAFGVNAYANFNLTTGLTGTVGSAATATITSVGGSWYRCSVTATCTTTVASAGANLTLIDSSTAARNPSYLGTAKFLYYWGAQLELASSVGTYIPTTTTAIYGTPTLSFSGVANVTLDSSGAMNLSSGSTGAINFNTTNGTGLSVVDAGNTVTSIVRVRGNTSNAGAAIWNLGSMNIGGFAVSLTTSPSNTAPGTTQFLASNTPSSVNYTNVTGGTTGNAVVISSAGSDTNIGMNLTPKGTGALNLAPGSSGVNISNGNTVTAITRTAPGSGYTSIPSVVISAPTVSGGVQATATASMFVATFSVASGGTGYTVSDVLTVSGGTGASATFTVSSVSGGVITAITILNNGSYTAIPTSPASVTGGTGSSATINLLTYGVGSSFTITNAGSGYVQQPTVTFSGGGGSGAAAFATVGSDTAIKSIGTNLAFNTPNGIVLRLADNGLGTNTGYVQISNAQGNGGATITTTGTNANTPLFVGSGGTGAVNFFTSGSSNIQMRVASTASAVNYIQATGAVTTGVPSIVAAGSDTNVALSIRGQGTGYLNLMNNQANYFQVYSAAAGSHPTMYAWGTDTDVNYNIASKGAGNIALRTNTGSNVQALIAHTANAVNYVQLTGAGTGGAPVISAQGADATAQLALTSKGATSLRFYTNTLAAEQARISHTASAVNFVQATGGSAGSGVLLSAQGSDANVNISLQAKGIGVIPFVSGYGNVSFQVNSQINNTNYGLFTSTSAATSPLLQVLGSDTNIDFRFRTQGTGAYQFDTGSNGNTQLRVAHTASANNYVQVTGSAGSTPIVSAQGADTNISLRLASKGTSPVLFSTNYAGTGTGNGQFSIAHTANTVNFAQVTGGPTGNYPIISGQGSDTNVGLILNTQGNPTGPGFRVQNQNGAYVCFAVQTSVVNPVNYVYMQPTATGSGPSVTANGTDTNIDLKLTPKGTGYANITSGGIKFPDATIQTTAASAALNVILQQSFGGF